jgi:hypothetical protein
MFKPELPQRTYRRCFEAVEIKNYLLKSAMDQLPPNIDWENVELEATDRDSYPVPILFNLYEDYTMSDDEWNAEVQLYQSRLDRYNYYLNSKIEQSNNEKQQRYQQFLQLKKEFDNV